MSRCSWSCRHLHYRSIFAINYISCASSGPFEGHFFPFLVFLFLYLLPTLYDRNVQSHVLIMLCGALITACQDTSSFKHLHTFCFWQKLISLSSAPQKSRSFLMPYKKFSFKWRLPCITQSFGTSKEPMKNASFQRSLWA